VDLLERFADGRARQNAVDELARSSRALRKGSRRAKQAVGLAAELCRPRFTFLATWRRPRWRPSRRRGVMMVPGTRSGKSSPVCSGMCSAHSRSNR